MAKNLTVAIEANPCPRSATTAYGSISIEFWFLDSQPCRAGHPNPMEGNENFSVEEAGEGR